MTRKRALAAIAIGIAVLAVGLAPTPVAAQETTTGDDTNASATDPAQAPTLAGDDQLHIVDHYVDDGTMFVELHAEQVRRVSVSAPPSDSGSQAGGYVTTALIQSGETQTVTVKSPTGTVWLSTTQSVENGRFTQLTDDSGSLLSGPFSSNDFLLAAIGGALGVAAMVLFKAIEAYFGRSESGERVA